MSQPIGKRSIFAVITGLLLLAGAFLPWRSALDATVLVGLCPGCTLYDSGAQALSAALGTNLLAELALLVAAATSFIAAGLLKNRPLSRKLALFGTAGTLLGVALARMHMASALAKDGIVGQLPGWAASWAGDDGLGQLMSGSQLGLGLFLTTVGLLCGITVSFSLLGEAKEDDGTTWMTPLAERSWFFELIEDFWFFLIERKAWWMTPIVVVMVMLVVLIIVSEKAAVLPFIYTLF
jgi:hypothetical protein